MKSQKVCLRKVFFSLTEKYKSTMYYFAVFIIEQGKRRFCEDDTGRLKRLSEATIIMQNEMRN